MRKLDLVYTITLKLALRMWLYYTYSKSYSEKILKKPSQLDMVLWYRKLAYKFVNVRIHVCIYVYVYVYVRMYTIKD